MVPSQNSANLVKHGLLVDVEDVSADGDDGVLLMLQRWIADDKHTSLNPICRPRVDGEGPRQVAEG
jgi:hypothetical protein